MARTRLIRRTVGASAVAAALAGAPAASAATVSLWHFDETSGTTAIDSVGGHNGTRQGSVLLGQPGFSRFAYGFPGQPGIVTIPSSPALNPGSASFRATVHIKTGVVTRDDSADVFRKGLSTNSKTLWKLELRPSSTGLTEKARCYFHGTSGIVSIYGPKNIADGAWHTITCVKSGSAVAIIQDGVTRTKAGTVGAISNSAPVTIGAKALNDDRYQGLVDEVSFSR